MLGERLKALRKKQGMRQRELSEILGVQKSTVSQYETNVNDPPDEIKTKLAKHFNVSLDYLLGIIDTEITCYDENYFWKIPEDMPEEDKQLVKKFIDFCEYKRKMIQ